MVSQRAIVLAGTAVAATAIVLYGIRRYRKLKEPVLDISETGTTAGAPNPADEAGATNVEQEAQRAKERGNKRFQGKQYKQAIEEYSKAIDLLSADSGNKNLAVYYGNRAQCYFMMEDYERALADCDASISIDPKYTKVFIRRGAVHEKLRNLEKSVVDFTAGCLLSHMQNEGAVQGCERVVKQLAEVKAKELLATPLRGLPSTHFISVFISSFRAIRLAISASRRPVATILAERRAASGVAQALLLSELALAHMKLNQFEEAMDAWKEAAEMVPWDKGDAFLLEWRAAAEASDSPDPGRVLTFYAMFTHLQGRHDEAMSLYSRALEVWPKQVETLAMRASLFFEKQQLPQAYGDFELALKLDPSHPDLYCHRGQLHLLQNDFSQAVSDLREAVRLDPDSVLAHVHLGMALHRNRQMTEALSAFDKAVQQFPTSPDVHNYLGELLIELNRLGDAAPKIEKAIALSGGKFALAFVNQAVLKMTQNDMPGAKALLRQAIEADPRCETAHVHLAHLHIQDKDLQAAIDSYDAAIQLLRVPQELMECCAMRESVYAQLTLLRTQGEIFEPVMEEVRQMQAQMQEQMQAQMQAQ